MPESHPNPGIRPRARAAAGILASILFVLAASTPGTEAARAQPPDTLWARTYGGSNIDVAYDVQPTTDGGFIVTGYTRSYGAAGHNLWLFKTGPDGQLEWNLAFGGSNDDEGQAVCQTSDGGYAAAGFTQSYGSGGKDVWLVKVDSLGTQQWTRSFGGSSDEEAYGLRETSDGGLVIAGATSSYGAGSRDMWLIKTDASGNLTWSRTFGGFGSDGAWSVRQTADSGYILAGWTFSYGPGAVGNAWLVKADSLGTMQWQQYFGGTGVDRAYEAVPTTDGGYVLAGYTDSYGAGLYDAYVVKAQSNGTGQWSESYGGTGRDYAYDLVVTPDGGSLAAGSTLSFGAGGDDIYLVRTDASGGLDWYMTYGGTASDVAYAIANVPDGGYIVAGHTLSSGAGVHDAWLIRLAPEGESSVPLPEAAHRLTVHVQPNPFTRAATIAYSSPNATPARLSILEPGGRVVRVLQGDRSPAGSGTIDWDGRDQDGRRVPPGIYFGRLEAGGHLAVVKLVRVGD